MERKIANHYNRLASSRDSYHQRNQYFHRLIEKQYQYLIPQNKRVLEIGCSTGNLLNAVHPSYGVGIDISEDTIVIAQKKYQHLTFYAGSIDTLKKETFDYIILSGLLGEVEDIESFLKQLHCFCTKDTRIIIEYYSYFWQLILRMGQKIGLKIPQPQQNWLTAGDIQNLLKLSNFESIKKERAILFPIWIPLISFLCNKILAKLPILNALTLSHFMIARPLFAEQKDYTVSILVPCRNEKGNIESAITRTPEFGLKQEFLFVEGNSSDGTKEEIHRIIAKYPNKNIRFIQQTGKGKGDAVRLGFSYAMGDILMILDADLTMPPEDLPKFYEAIKNNKGEFINGCRLVYPMEDEAMQFLNLIANKFFGVFFSWLLGQRFKDTLCGTKVLFKNHYDEIVANRHYFGDFDPFGDFDLIFGAVKLNLKVIEVPIRYKNRQYGTTQIQRFKHGILLFRMCWFAMRKIKFL